MKTSTTATTTTVRWLPTGAMSSSLLLCGNCRRYVINRRSCVKSPGPGSSAALSVCKPAKTTTSQRQTPFSVPGVQTMWAAVRLCHPRSGTLITGSIRPRSSRPRPLTSEPQESGSWRVLASRPMIFPSPNRSPSRNVFNLRLQGDFFNAFNVANFSGLGTTVDNGGFGTLSSAYPGRNLQLGLKVVFLTTPTYPASRSRRISAGRISLLVRQIFSSPYS